MPAWSDYQEKTAEFFRGLGLDAETNVTLQGVRTKHDIDVVVRADHVGFDLLWLVECKFWQVRVTKLHVLALREIVADLGADRGILMAEAGFQRGAIEAATLTNVQLTSLANLQKDSSHAIGMARLREIQNRISTCQERYWAIDKRTRIRYGLRHDVSEIGYSGGWVIETANEALNEAFRDHFPVVYSDLVALVPELRAIGRLGSKKPPILETPNDLANFIDLYVADLEERLNSVETTLKNRSDEPPCTHVSAEEQDKRPSP